MTSLKTAIKQLRQAVEARRKKPNHEKYRQNAAGYCRDILKVRLTPQQNSIAEAVGYEPRILVPSANEVGKSFLGACLALWHYDVYKPGITILSAPAQNQLTDVLFKELRRLSPGRTGWLPRSNRLQDSEDHFLTGLVARDEESYKGRHDGHVMGMFDEAEGIPLEFWDGGATMFDTWICFYNPTMTSSPASSAERQTNNGVPVWRIFRLSALDHPNLVCALRGEEIPFPRAVTLTKVKDRLARWATRIEPDEPPHPDDIVLDGVRWRCGPIAQPRILGIRPTGSSNSIFTEAIWNKLSNARHKLQDHWPLQIGCDVARFGEDYTAIVVRRGIVALHAEMHNGWTNLQVAKRLKELACRFANENESPLQIPILIDDTGQGGGPTDLGEDYRFIGVNFQWKSDREEEFPDVRSQLWFDFAEISGHGDCDISRMNPDMQNTLRDQLLAPLYSIDRKSRRCVESKEHTKKRLGQGSPDLADAFLLAFSPAVDHFERYTVLG